MKYAFFKAAPELLIYHFVCFSVRTSTRDATLAKTPEYAENRHKAMHPKNKKLFRLKQVFFIKQHKNFLCITLSVCLSEYKQAVEMLP